MSLNRDDGRRSASGIPPELSRPLDALQFRRIMGRFATGVTVLTTAVGGEYYGMTANAVCSVSLDPLLVLVCVDRAAYMHDALLRSGRFALSILGEDQAELSRLFAAAAPPQEGELRGVPFSFSPGGLPLPAESLAWIECEVTETHRGGDHTIFVAGVTGGHVRSEGPPVVFYHGGYWRIGEQVQ